MELFGIDLTLPLFLLITFLGLAGLEYLLCRISRWRPLRLLPWIIVVGLLFLSVASLFGKSGGWIDMRGFFALIFAVYALICGSALLTGWYLAKRKSK